jgi:hypothetical protein
MVKVMSAAQALGSAKRIRTFIQPLVQLPATLPHHQIGEAEITPRVNPHKLLPLPLHAMHGIAIPEIYG